MEKWEYCQVSSGPYGITIDFGGKTAKQKAGVQITVLNELGADRWELVGFAVIGAAQYFTLKRPKTA